MALERRLRLVTNITERNQLDTALKVAFATSDMKHVDQHFGAAGCFAIYTLDPEQANLSEAVQFGRLAPGGRPEGRRINPVASENPAAPSGSAVPNADALGVSVTHRQSLPGDAGPPLNASGHQEDKLAAKIAALDGCIAVYCQAVGASAINQLLAHRIQAVKVSPDSLIRDLILDLQGQLRTGPSAWLARAIELQKPKDGRRFDEMELEGWVE